MRDLTEKVLFFFHILRNERKKKDWLTSLQKKLNENEFTLAEKCNHDIVYFIAYAFFIKLFF